MLTLKRADLSGILTLKSSMVRTLRNHIREKGISDEAAGVPTTFVLYPQRLRAENLGEAPDENATENTNTVSLQQAMLQRRKKAAVAEADERALLLAAHDAARESSGAGEEIGPIWIAKASAGGKGQGILVSRCVEDVLKHIDSSSSDTAWVVSRYLEDPMLLDGRKFDVRCWVLLDSGYRVHVFEDGVARTTSYKYDLSDLTNPLQHLTNHCIQATSDEYQKFEAGNELSFEQLEAYLAKSANGKAGWHADIVPQMHSIINLCFDAARPQLAPVDAGKAQGLSQFQLFGFDFLVDARYKVWLLEINGRSVYVAGLERELRAGLAGAVGENSKS